MRVNRHSRESGNPDDVPAEAGNHHSGIWIPPYRVRGRLSQARNDKWAKIYIVMYNTHVKINYGRRTFGRSDPCCR